jgi:predicted TIM-barrel fold metal-dependent hydrolase
MNARSIETHAHFLPEEYFALLLEEAERDPEFGRAHARVIWIARENIRPLRNLDALRQQMEDADVAVSAVSIPPPAAAFGDRARQREVAEQGNDGLLSALEPHEGHLNALVILPNDPDDAIAELERVGRHPLCRGVAMQTVTTGVLIDDVRLEPLYRLAAELGLIVQTHPALEPLREGWTDFLLPSSFAPLVSSSFGAARLILSGMLDRVPDLDVVIPHLGGMLPYILGRFVDFGQGDAAHTMDHYFAERLYMDTCALHAPALRCALEVSSPRRLMLGSDFPYRHEIKKSTDFLEEHVPDAADREAILFGTASRWFGPDARASTDHDPTHSSTPAKGQPSA